MIHLHGAGGQPFRPQGRLLASRGLATLALQYFGDPDPVPDSLTEVPVEYVERDRSPAGTSAWSIDGDPVPYLELAEADPGLPYFAPPLSNASESALAAATVPVENADVPFYLVSGTDDRRWPSTRLSERVIDRLDASEYDQDYRHDAHERAGRYLTFPYLPTPGSTRTRRNVYGGTPAANARAVADAWTDTRSFFDDAFGV